MDLVPDHVSSVLVGEGADRDEPGLFSDTAGWVIVCSDVSFGVADPD